LNGAKNDRLEVSRKSATESNPAKDCLAQLRIFEREIQLRQDHLFQIETGGRAKNAASE
jgi:hypothetical protein